LDLVDLGRELRDCVQPLGEAAEVVLARPVVGERLQRGQLDALRPIVDELLARPARRLDTPAQVVDLFLWNLDVEGPDLGGRFDGGAHEDTDELALPARHGKRRSSSARACAPDSPKRRTHMSSQVSSSKKNFQSLKTVFLTNRKGTGDWNGR